MPLKLNCGLSRKVGDNNYGSRGASINVEVEVESALAGEPAKLQERIRQLFGLVRTSLAEELNGGGQAQTRANGNGHDGQNQPNSRADSREGNGQKGNSPRPATQSQVRAIAAISKRMRVNLDEVLRNRFQVRRTQDLSIREASQLIDELKGDSQEGG